MHLFCPGTQYNDIPGGWCWNPRTTGTVIMEAWGSGGSGPKMCCCGGGIPGNTGAYTKKYLCVSPLTSFCGSIGFACTCDNVCFKGCSEATCWCWTCAFDCNGTAYNGCVCAQGGLGGLSICNPNTGSLYCCFLANGYCGTVGTNANCGVICNISSSYPYRGQGYISTCNCCSDKSIESQISCTSFFGLESSCNTCYFQHHLGVPPGLFTACGGRATYTSENNNEFSNWSGQGRHEALHSINALSRFPGRGTPWSACWQFSGGCGCYESTQCVQVQPVAFGGTPGNPCPGVRDHAGRGGMGAVKFTFLPCYLA